MWIRNLHWETKCVRRFPERIGTLQGSYAILEQQYDPVGRAYKASNPTTAAPNIGPPRNSTDWGHPTKTILPDTKQTTFSYSLQTVTVTDPAGKQRKAQSDGIGRLGIAYEPDLRNGNQLTQQTSYSYTALDALAAVTQGSQTRTYGYDKLGRLTSVATPETTGVSASYQYNDFDLVTQRTDARGVITTYGYDTLNRLHTVSYNVGTTGVPATASLTYTYGSSPAQNNNGRLITMTDGVGSAGGASCAGGAVGGASGSAGRDPPSRLNTSRRSSSPQPGQRNVWCS